MIQFVKHAQMTGREAANFLARFEDVLEWKSYVARHGDRPDVHAVCPLGSAHNRADALFERMQAFELNYYNVWVKKNRTRAAGYLAWLLNGRHKVIDKPGKVANRRLLLCP